MKIEVIYFFYVVVFTILCGACKYKNQSRIHKNETEKINIFCEDFLTKDIVCNYMNSSTLLKKNKEGFSDFLKTELDYKNQFIINEFRIDSSGFQIITLIDKQHICSLFVSRQYFLKYSLTRSINTGDIFFTMENNSDSCYLRLNLKIKHLISRKSEEIVDTGNKFRFPKIFERPSETEILFVYNNLSSNWDYKILSTEHLESNLDLVVEELLLFLESDECIRKIKATRIQMLMKYFRADQLED